MEGIRKRFGAGMVLDNAHFSVKTGEFCVLVGPSGSGKSTLLHIIAGLEKASSGEVFIEEQQVTSLPPRERDVAMVFQSYALYPHMTVFENMAFPLRVAGMSKGKQERRVGEAALLLAIEDLLERYPRQLSGGQRQRVAIGRAIVRRPRLFLFDEPLSNLDARLRVTMRAELAALHKKLGATILYVTHDQTEAMTLGSKLVILDEGRIQQAGSPSEVYKTPENLFVATFIGSPEMNLIEGMVEQEAPSLFRAQGIQIALPFSIGPGPLTIGVRPEDLFLQQSADRIPIGIMTVTLIENLGPEKLVYVQAHGRRMVARCDPEQEVVEGRLVPLFANYSRLHCFRKGQRVGMTNFE